jgi:hypothetical protein
MKLADLDGDGINDMLVVRGQESGVLCDWSAKSP